ncbi:glycosyltransferase [Novosphingobium sp.]|uniref:glycosyltransferase n=1 Tax=Novosphingobium sp. TaxID=1874826 RepID=UPI00286C7022|nr:glycosyltransferase [Novosphingobium sp.]
MTMPAVSVAMSVYNGERFLVPAIESVLAQTMGDFEFLILDDGSRDQSRALAESYAARDARIRVIARENHGLVISLNQLLAEARAPLVARMDADDICLPERFARQIAFLAQHNDHGVLGSRTSDIDEYDRPYPLAAGEHPETHAELVHNIAHGGPLLAHPTVMYRRDVVLAAGGYHQAFRHCEDYDLWLRLAGRTRIANLPERLLRYRHYADQVSSRHALEQQVGVAVSCMAWQERMAGRPDPTETLLALPPIAALDDLFGRAGIASEVRGRVARALVYSRSALREGGFDMLLEHVGEGGRGAELWRTVVRLARFGEPRRALQLAAALARG